MTHFVSGVGMDDVRAQHLQHDGAAFVVLSYSLRDGTRFAGLTPSELGVVEAVLEGRSSREIAALRHVSTRTIANQLAAAYRKLGVSGAAALIRLAHGADGHPNSTES